MRVTFIGGFKDGEVSDMPNVEPRLEFRELEQPRVLVDGPPGGRDCRPFKQSLFHVKSDWYRLEHLVSFEEKFFFYVEDSIPSNLWVSKLVDGYNPIPGEGD